MKSKWTFEKEFRANNMVLKKDVLLGFHDERSLYDWWRMLVDGDVPSDVCAVKTFFPYSFLDIFLFSVEGEVS
jgi:hypothetical protein